MTSAIAETSFFDVTGHGLARSGRGLVHDIHRGQADWPGQDQQGLEYGARMRQHHWFGGSSKTGLWRVQLL